MRFLISFFFLVSLYANEKLIIAKIENLKPYYYNNQIVNLKLKIITATDGNLSIKDEYNRTYNYPNITFQLKDKFPTFTIEIKKDNRLLDKTELKIDSKIKKLYPPKNFTNIIAHKFIIEDKILTNYNQVFNIIYLNLYSDGNIKDFTLHLPNEKISASENGKFYTYSAFIPIDKNQIKLSYFDLNEERYKTIKFKLAQKKEEVSTQTDIKPMKKSYVFAINSFLITLLVVISALYYYRRKKIYLFFIVITIISIIFFNLPKKTITLNEGTKIHILPFKNSTIFMVIETKTEAKILNQTKNFYKIEFYDRIGWVEKKESKNEQN
jgi:hypothetical protein